MLDLSWSSDIAKDPLRLADAIELVVAFDDASFGRFTQAEFQNVVDSENYREDDQSYLTEDETDERNGQFEDALELIRKRAEWLGSAYPFRADSVEVQFKPHPTFRTTPRRHLTYLFLLVCANGNSVPTLKSKLPDQFEVLCKEALRALFPISAEVLLFSRNSRDRNAVFGHAAKKAVPALAQMLNAKLVENVQLPDTPREYGIDIVAIVPFGDRSSFPFFAFAQCTIAQQWSSKRHEAIADSALTEVINLNARHTNFLMIPHFPRYDLVHWDPDAGPTGNCILCDRFRICKLLESSSFFEQDSFPDSIANVFSALEGNLDSTHGFHSPQQ